LGLALDEPGDDDETADHAGVTFMIGADLDRFVSPRAKLAVGLDPWHGSIYVRVAGQREC